MSRPLVVSVSGPTGTGKTSASLALAARIPATVVNFDSRQVYRDFPIITAQPDQKEQSACPHLLYEFLETDETIHAGAFVDMAKRAIHETLEAGRTPILVGGTGMYLRSLVHGLAPIPAIPAEVRAKVLAEVADAAPGQAHARLAAIDPEYAARIHQNDRQRIGRALEVFEATGKILTWWHTQTHGKLEHDCLKLGLSVSMAELEPRLALRIDLMLEAGAVEEARGAWEKCPDSSAPGWSGIGCREMLDYVRGRADLESTKALWLKNTRAYAKRQMTWFRKDRPQMEFGLGRESDIVEAVLSAMP